MSPYAFTAAYVILPCSSSCTVGAWWGSAPASTARRKASSASGTVNETSRTPSPCNAWCWAISLIGVSAVVSTKVMAFCFST